MSGPEPPPGAEVAYARTSPNSRRLLVRRIEDEPWGVIPAPEAAGISERSARKWLARWRAKGDAGLISRSSAPRRPTRLPTDPLEAIEALRRLRMTAAEIAEVLGLALSTVSKWLRRIGLGRRSALDRRAAGRRRAGELHRRPSTRGSRASPRVAALDYAAGRLEACSRPHHHFE